MDFVVLAALQLGGDNSPIDTEDVAMEANRLAPGRFTWRKYPDQVSIEHIRVYLSDAKKPKNGRLLTGDGTRGWRLTQAGVQHAVSCQGACSLEVRPRVDRELERRRKIESVRISDLPAWKKHLTGESVSRREAEAVFRIDEYVRGTRREQLIERSRILFIDDQDFGPFIEAMAGHIRALEENS